MPFVFYVAIPLLLVFAYLNSEKHHYWLALAALLAPLAPVTLHWLATEVSWLRNDGSGAPTLWVDLVGLAIAVALAGASVWAALFVETPVESRRPAPNRQDELMLT